jgi:hypothetical protein
VALDHPWAVAHPEYFIAGTLDDLSGNPISYTAVGDRILACGRDPYSPPWEDVLQCNAFHPGLRQAATETVIAIASQCDGIRCDMAMLVINTIFVDTWGERAGPQPASEYWVELIQPVRRHHTDFLFIAEVYWNKEWELRKQGFDYCYDKRLFDRLEHDGAESIRLHLSAEVDYQDRLVRFLENRDEPRAADVFSSSKERVAAVIATALPGAKLFHEGQLEGRRIRVLVFLRRRPQEPPDEALRSFYQQLVQLVGRSKTRAGAWRLCDSCGWPDDLSHRHLLAWCWRIHADGYLIVVNYSETPAQGQVRLDWDDLQGAHCQLHDRFSGAVFERGDSEMVRTGLCVNLPPWGFHYFELMVH